MRAVGFVLLVEFGIIARDGFGQFAGFRIVLLLEHHLGATQRNDGRPTIALVGDVLGQFVETLLSGDEVVGSIGDFGIPEFGGQRQFALGELGD